MTAPDSPDYAGKKILVVGAARSGMASAAFLLARGAAVTITDNRKESFFEREIADLRKYRGPGQVYFEFGGHNPESFRKSDLVVVSPGVPLSLPWFSESRRCGVPVIAEVELGFRHLKGKILGVTGSNGKTTTTTLAAELLNGAGLKCLAAGNIGVPLISLAENSREEDYYAVELSSFQLEGIKEFRPHIGALLNLTPDHMDRYEGFEAYAAAKERLFINQKSCDFAVLNADDPRVLANRSRIASMPVLFSRKTAVPHGVFVEGQRIIYQTSSTKAEIFQTTDIRLMGNHNLENVLAACAVAILAGADPVWLKPVIKEFRGVEHRLEWVAEIAGVRYFNDSKATNVDSTLKSLEAFPGNIHLIAGGRDKAGDFSILRPIIQERVRQVVLIGEAAGKIRESLKGTTEIREAGNLAEAVAICSESALPGDIVLLAPACASFDMFDNFQHRGRIFKEAVAALKPQS